MTTNIEHEKEARKIDDDAAVWAARRLSGSFSKEDSAMLADWLDADRRHKAAFDDYMRVADRAALAANVASRRPMVANQNDVKSSKTARWRWLVTLPALAASVAMVFFVTFATSRPAAKAEKYATQLGESSEITLQDGTIIALNTNTQLTITMTDAERNVVMEHGEALFNVTRDVNRPFTVKSPAAQITVLGTQFNVLERQEATVISVLSGVVEVAGKLEDANPSKVTLTDGYEVAFSNNGSNSSVRTFNPDAVTAWRRGVAYYENKALSEVIADLNRYFEVPLALGDATLADIPVTGNFDLGNQSVAVKGLSVALSLRAERHDGSEIVLLPDE